MIARERQWDRDRETTENERREIEEGERVTSAVKLTGSTKRSQSLGFEKNSRVRRSFSISFFKSGIAGRKSKDKSDGHHIRWRRILFVESFILWRYIKFPAKRFASLSIIIIFVIAAAWMVVYYCYCLSVSIMCVCRLKNVESFVQLNRTRI